MNWNPTENCFLTTYHSSFMVCWWVLVHCGILPYLFFFSGAVSFLLFALSFYIAFLSHANFSPFFKISFFFSIQIFLVIDTQKKEKKYVAFCLICELFFFFFGFFFFFLGAFQNFL